MDSGAGKVGGVSQGSYDGFRGFAEVVFVGSVGGGRCSSSREEIHSAYGVDGLLQVGKRRGRKTIPGVNVIADVVIVVAASKAGTRLVKEFLFSLSLEDEQEDSLKLEATGDTGVLFSEWLLM